MYDINPIIDKQNFSRHIEIAEILWDEPNDRFSLEEQIYKTDSNDLERNLNNSALDGILFDLVTLNWVVIKHDMYCLTPFGRKTLENISDHSFIN